MDWDAFWKQTGAFLVDFELPLRVLAIIAGALLLRWLLTALIRRVVRQVVSGAKRRQGTDDTSVLLASPLAQARVVQRARTLGGVLGNLVTWAVWIVASTLLLDALGVNLTAVLAGAGLVGAIIAFGAQTVIRDLVNGLIMVFEDQYGVGDIVDLGPASGIVESVGARITRLRDGHGTVWFVRNGEVLRVANQSLGWARVLLDITVPADAPTEPAEHAVLKAAQELARTPQWRAEILEPPQLWGVQEVVAGATVLRLVLKTRSGAMEDVARELRGRAVAALQRAGIAVQSLHTPQPAGLASASWARGPRIIATTPILIAGEPAPASVPAARAGGAATRVQPATRRRPGGKAGA